MRFNQNKEKTYLRLLIFVRGEPKSTIWPKGRCDIDSTSYKDRNGESNNYEQYGDTQTFATLKSRNGDPDSGTDVVGAECFGKSS